MANAYPAKNLYDYCNNDICNGDNCRLLYMQSPRNLFGMVLTETGPT